MCSFIMEYDVHTLLDLLTLATTGWIIFIMMTQAKGTWQADKDTLWEVYIVRPEAASPWLVQPGTHIFDVSDMAARAVSILFGINTVTVHHMLLFSS